MLGTSSVAMVEELGQSEMLLGKKYYAYRSARGVLCTLRHESNKLRRGYDIWHFRVRETREDAKDGHIQHRYGHTKKTGPPAGWFRKRGDTSETPP